jgi:hypothetical protein
MRRSGVRFPKAALSPASPGQISAEIADDVPIHPSKEPTGARSSRSQRDKTRSHDSLTPAIGRASPSSIENCLQQTCRGLSGHGRVAPFPVASQEGQRQLPIDFALKRFKSILLSAPTI